LLDQSLPPNKIIIAIPKTSRRQNTSYDIPSYLLKMPHVEIIRAEIDHGPATKLIPALKKFWGRGDVILIAVDDDNIYPSRFIENIWQAMQKNPEIAYGTCGKNLAAGPRWLPENRSTKSPKIQNDTPTDILMGCGGIGVRPTFFDTSVFDYSDAPPEAFYVDDIWFNGHLARRGVERHVVAAPLGYSYLPTWATIGTLALDKTANRENHNNDATVKYFANAWGEHP